LHLPPFRTGKAVEIHGLAAMGSRCHSLCSASC
jgi:hypothetical protein